MWGGFFDWEESDKTGQPVIDEEQIIKLFCPKGNAIDL